MSKKKNFSEDAKNFYFNEQNKKKEKILKDKYGMSSMGTSSEASPEIMNNFLNYIEQYEDQYQTAEKKKIIEILGFPKFKNIKEIDFENISKEIDTVMSIYAEHNFNIDVIEEDEVTEEDFYKFLTEELTDYETIPFDIEGMNTNFIYEEFHPCDKLTAKDTINFFFWSLESEKEEGDNTWLSRNEIFINGIQKTQPEFMKELRNRIPGKTGKHDIVFKSFEFNPQIKVEAELTINTDQKIKNPENEKQMIINLMFILERTDLEYFTVKEIDFLDNNNAGKNKSL